MPKKKVQKPQSGLAYPLSSEDQDWLDIRPVGREFGSPDYERLTALDDAAFSIFQSWEQVRVWLAEPNSELGGASPEDVARSSDGLQKIMSILMLAGARASGDFMLEVEDLPLQERDSL